MRQGYIDFSSSDYHDYYEVKIVAHDRFALEHETFHLLSYLTTGCASTLDIEEVDTLISKHYFSEKRRYF